MSSVMMRELTWKEISRLANENTVVILPTAAIEQHGPHLPIEVDARIVEDVAKRSAERVVDQIPVLVAPTLSYGVSDYHMAFSGTMTLSMGTFLTVVEELSGSLIHHGFRRILILNGHGGNHDPIVVAARNIAVRTGVTVVTASYWNIAAKELAEFQRTEVGAIPGHACGFETSCMMALRPELVREHEMFSWTTTEPGQGLFYGSGLGSVAQVQLPKQSRPRSEYGWSGDPTLATAAKGERYLGIIEERVAAFLIDYASGDPIPAKFQFAHP